METGIPCPLHQGSNKTNKREETKKQEGGNKKTEEGKKDIGSPPQTLLSVLYEFALTNV